MVVIDVTKEQINQLIALNLRSHKEGWLAWFRADPHGNVAPCKSYGYGGFVARDPHRCTGKDPLLDRLVVELLKVRQPGGRIFVLLDGAWHAEDIPESDKVFVPKIQF